MAYLDSWLYLAHDKCRPDRDHLSAIDILWHMPSAIDILWHSFFSHHHAKNTSFPLHCG